MSLQDSLQELMNKVDADYAEWVHQAAWVNGVWSWDNALAAHAEGKEILAKIEEVRQLAQRYGQAETVKA